MMYKEIKQDNQNILILLLHFFIHHIFKQYTHIFQTTFYKRIFSSSLPAIDICSNNLPYFEFTLSVKTNCYLK